MPAMKSNSTKRKRAPVKAAVAPAINTANASNSDDDDAVDVTRPKSFADEADSDDASNHTNTNGDSDSDSEDDAPMVDEHDAESAFIRGAASTANRKHRRSGGFQNMGLSSTVFNAVIKKGYKVPTPIQRKTIPMILQGKDVVAMARTGSGKTAAFLIPMLERLKGHSVRVGPRAIVLSPSRELATQTMKFAKELGRFSDLRCAIVVGGDGIEEQFAQIASNPDIIIATPGRLLHLVMEMSLELNTVEYLVFDEADRLFEMGFSEAINELLHKIPSGRQSVLFSATLPRMLVDFAKAGLHNPVLVRLDVDSKISPDLSLAFFPVKPDMKEAALMYLIRDSGIIRPDHQTIIFAATRHHVEYLHELLLAENIDNSYIYGQLDQTARQLNLAKFRAGTTRFLVVTDVAARGIDIPFLNNVINYDFTDKCKLFVHRAGRAARAGRTGTAYSFITQEDLPYLVDLHLFLGRPLVLGGNNKDADLTKDVLYADMPSALYTDQAEAMKNLLAEKATMDAMKKVSMNGHRLYLKTRCQASRESYTRAKQIIDQAPVGSVALGVHPLFVDGQQATEMVAALSVMDQLRNFRPQETIFEVRKMGLATRKSPADAIMKQRRRLVGNVISQVRQDKRKLTVGHGEKTKDNHGDSNSSSTNLEQANEDEIESTFIMPASSKKRRLATADATDPKRFRDAEHYVAHRQAGADVEREYQVDNGADGPSSSFAQAAAGAQMDLVGDDSDKMTAALRAGKLTWDKKKRRFTRATVGADNKKMIRSESGALLPASYKTDAFNRWQKKTKQHRLPRAGEEEVASSFAANTSLSARGRQYRHTAVTAPKPLDPRHTNYERKLQARTKKQQQQQLQSATSDKSSGNNNPDQLIRAAEARKNVRSELKSAVQVRKERQLKEKRREKNARPSKKASGFKKSRDQAASSMRGGHSAGRGRKRGGKR